MLKNISKFILVLAFLSFCLLLVKSSDLKKVAVSAETSISDQDGDGIIDLEDARILTPPQSANCPVCVDVNGDELIDQKDVNIVQYSIAQQLPYRIRFDVNNDRVINIDDVNLITSYLGQNVTKPVFGLDNPSQLTYGFLAGDMMLKFKEGTSQQQKDSLFAKYNLSAKKDFPQINLVEVGANQSNVESLQKQIESEPQVQKAKKSLIYEPMASDPYWPDQWGPNKINIPPAWFIGITGKSSVKVGIIDTGVDYNHEDLAQNLSQNRRFNAINFNPNLPFEYQDLSDPVGHGTGMVGIIAATTNNGKGIAGINWNVEIIPTKSCVPDLERIAICPSPYLVSGLSWLIYQDIDVVNMSIGRTDFTDRDEDIEYYLDLFKQLGIPVIAAAGNSGGDNRCIFPGEIAGVTCVSATDTNDNFAFCSDGKTDSDISAPGENIISTVAAGSLFDVNNNGYNNLSCGTSMATAHITGLVALCKTVEAQDPRNFLKCDHFNNFDKAANRRIDAWPYLWYRSCKVFDNTGTDNRVGLNDIARIAWAIGSPQSYNVKLDVFPAGGDGVINGSDLYSEVFGHAFDKCQ